MTIETVRYGQAVDTTRTAVATFLTPIERQRVDAAGQGCYTTLHRESLDDLMVDLRTRAVSAVLVSVARYQTQHATQVARLVREFPRVPAVALLTISEPHTTRSLLALGQQGVRALVKGCAKPQRAVPLPTRASRAAGRSGIRTSRRRAN